MNPIVYLINGLKRPCNSQLIRILVKLNKIPVLRNLTYKILLREFKFPITTSLNEGFYSTSQLIHIGDNVGLADTYILAYAPVNIGSNCSFSYRNIIITSTHDINNFSTVVAKPVSIGNNCWITTNCTILPGVSIGDNTIIGAGSVVTQDIPSNVFAAGNPCKVIREIKFNK